MVQSARVASSADSSQAWRSTLFSKPEMKELWESYRLALAKLDGGFVNLLPLHAVETSILWRCYDGRLSVHYQVGNQCNIVARALIVPQCIYTDQQNMQTRFPFSQHTTVTSVRRNELELFDSRISVLRGIMVLFRARNLSTFSSLSCKKGVP